MYPRVKVRQEMERVSVEEKETSRVVRIVESLSLENHSFPRILVPNQEHNCKSDPRPPHARVSTSHLKNPSTPPVDACKGKNDKELDGDNKTNIRASSVPRPRAVLSSPDNDGIIGTQNQRIRERRTPLGRQTRNGDSITALRSQVSRERTLLTKLQSSAPAQGKPSIKDATVESPPSTRKPTKKASNNSTPRERQPKTSGQKQRPPFTLRFSD
ncbi:uncharacterized protein M6B38_288450 [Iris pallida]|uniref:Uncharacterized protein n=1 Tax=Iris pallida TaxID=29817 RepID=A0AAX6HXK5_IRIPA|nr:uncharacterized protein M6B38_288450 [Iris pallida]